MQARFKHDGKAVDYISATDIPAGSVVIIEDLVGITKLDLLAGRLGALHLVGVFEVEKDAVAIPLGSKVYFDAATQKAVLTATGNKQLGIAVGEADAEAATVLVRIGS